MATIFNTAEVNSARAPAAAVGDEVTWVSQWDAATGGNLERTFPLFFRPAALRLGEQIQFAPGELLFQEIGRTGLQLAGVLLTAAGTGYTSAPTVSFAGGGGAGAVATATINAAGEVTEITVTDPGYGYTSAPTVSLAGDGSGAAATALLNGIASERSAAQRLNGEFSTNKWYQFHTDDPGTDGTMNVIPIGRAAQPATNWTAGT